MRKILLATALLLSTAGATLAADGSGDAQAINKSCESDAAKTGCDGKTVGDGLVKCMAAYKKAHSDFKFSDDCKTALKKGGDDYKAAKASQGGQ